MNDVKIILPRYASTKARRDNVFLMLQRLSNVFPTLTYFRLKTCFERMNVRTVKNPKIWPAEIRFDSLTYR